MAFLMAFATSVGWRMTVDWELAAWLARPLAIWMAVGVLVRFAFSASFRATAPPQGVDRGYGGTGAAAARPPRIRRTRLVRAGFHHQCMGADGRAAASIEDLMSGVRVRDEAEVDAHRGGPGALSPAFLRDQRIWGVVIAGSALTARDQAALLDIRLRGLRVLSDRAFLEDVILAGSNSTPSG